MMKNIGRFLLIGLGTLIFVPTLSVLSVALIGSSIIILIVGLLRSLGIGNSYLQMTLWPGYEIPTALSFPVALVVGALLGFIGYKSWKLLKHFLSFVKSPPPLKLD